MLFTVQRIQSGMVTLYCRRTTVPLVVTPPFFFIFFFHFLFIFLFIFLFHFLVLFWFENRFKVCTVPVSNDDGVPIASSVEVASNGAANANGKKAAEKARGGHCSSRLATIVHSSYDGETHRGGICSTHTLHTHGSLASRMLSCHAMSCTVSCRVLYMCQLSEFATSRSL